MNQSTPDAWQTLVSFVSTRAYGHLLQIIDTFFLGILPLVLVGASVYVTVRISDRRKRKTLGVNFRPLILAFGVFGTMLGLLIGASREPVVGAALPVLVTLVTGFLTYFTQKGTALSFRHCVPAMIIALATGSIFGAYYSSIPRNGKESSNLKFERINAPIRVKFCQSLSDGIANGSDGALKLFESYRCLVRE